MMHWPQAANIMCPYYLKEGEKTITCEGYMCTEIVRKFGNYTEKEDYQRKHCFFYPNECMLASANDLKYENVKSDKSDV